ncbi:HAD-IA family hydrolase [Piscirickettsia litoralis]|uniref:Haloacid dehalogenase, type II n=1 Tax=Piscirickettsia litoralis TaxID=1891921 RepID=A0ABX3A4F7_9GAMM|nr:HAD-IA family hydrolase [Piscirickettsia litoralis]ODN43132.1 hypothetical protein BGC07_09680 [Piscirickettsia litoralis]
MFRKKSLLWHFQLMRKIALSLLLIMPSLSLAHSKVPCSLERKLANIQLITFDLYAALSESASSVTRNITSILKSKKLTPAQIKQFTDTWFSNYSTTKNYNGYIQSTSVAKMVGVQHFQLFDMMLKSTLTYTIRSLSFTKNLKFSQSDIASMMNAWDKLTPLPGTIGALKKLQQAGYKLAILSNGSRQRIQDVINNEGYQGIFSYIISSSSVNRFKPDPKIYAEVMEKTHLNKDQILHVAGAGFDAIGSRAFGYLTAWNNVNHVELLNSLLSKRYEPNIVLDNLSELPDIMAQSHLACTTG